MTDLPPEIKWLRRGPYAEAAGEPYVARASAEAAVRACEKRCNTERLRAEDEYYAVARQRTVAEIVAFLYGITLDADAADDMSDLCGADEFAEMIESRFGIRRRDA